MNNVIHLIKIILVQFSCFSQLNKEFTQYSFSPLLFRDPNQVARVQL